MMLFVANALPPHPFGGLIVTSRAWPLSDLLDEVRAIAKDAIDTAIGHPSTAELLGIAPNRRSIAPCYGDIFVAVRLATRATAPGDMTVMPSDLLVQVALYRPIPGHCSDPNCFGDYLTQSIRILEGGPEVARALASGATKPRCIIEERTRLCPSCGQAIKWWSGDCQVCG
jgi:hypothetical protein